MMRVAKTPVPEVSSESKDPEPNAQIPTRKHLQTPTKARIQTLYRDRSQREIKQILKQEDNIDISQTTISRIVNDENPRRVGNCPEKPETRGRKRRFTEAQLDSVEHVLDTYDNVEQMSWKEIASASGIGDLTSKWEWQRVREGMARRGRGKTK